MAWFFFRSARLYQLATFESEFSSGNLRRLNIVSHHQHGHSQFLIQPTQESKNL